MKMASQVLFITYVNTHYIEKNPKTVFWQFFFLSVDNSEDIQELFEGQEAPPNSPIDLDVITLQKNVLSSKIHCPK